MSYLAIGSTTKALVELLKRKLNKPALLGSGITLEVTTLPPDDDRLGDATGVNLYLYRIAESPFLRNTEYRGERGKTNGSRRLPLAVTLNYLVTAYAKKAANSLIDDILAHQVLGNAMSILHEYAVLNDVHDSDFDADLDAHFPAELRDSLEKVKVALVPTSMDEFSKIWTGLSKAYRLSVAYEVSLIQLPPLAPSKVAAPPPQRVSLTATPFELPSIIELAPSRGAAGTEVTLRGSGFSSLGALPIVTFGDIELAATDLLRADPHEIVFVVPDRVALGPMVSVSVTLQGRTSPSRAFEIAPFIRNLVPLRGPAGIPLRFAFEVPPLASVSVTIDGVAAATTVDATTKTVSAIVPTSIATNGAKPVVLTVAGAPPQDSNVLFYELEPRVTSLTVTPGVAPTRTTVTLQGERLAGQHVEVRYAGVLANKGENANPAQVEVVFERALPIGQHVSVRVDGRESDPFPPHIERLAPVAAAVGDRLTIRGDGLSGQNVSVTFDATTIALGPRPFSHELTVDIPLGLAPGSVSVRTTVDGVDTNSLPLEVSA
ncbi:MAG TPA: Pvc16 family protein [Polyangiaceae bacterium]|nr:Pvc16 family protein [Polyangiaceae bacterium]